MTPIDPTKIRPGDKVTFHEATVICASHHRICVKWDDGKQGDIWLSAIATHTPKPREFKRGDFVTWGSGATVWEIEVVRGKMACVVLGDDGISLQPISNLRHADDGADR